MSKYRVGDIVRIEYPFTDHSGSKVRPAVVISSPRYNREKPDVILLPLTSKLRHGDSYGTVVLQDWKDAGLLQASVIKPIPHTTVQTNIESKMGELSQSDKGSLKSMLLEILGFTV